jgi:hypothetical protein
MILFHNFEFFKYTWLFINTFIYIYIENKIKFTSNIYIIWYNPAMNNRKYNIDISKNNKTITINASGQYDLDSTKNLIHKVIMDPRFNPEYDLLVDIRDVKYIPKINEIFSISNFVLSFKQYFKKKIAIIASGEILIKMFKVSSVFISKQGMQSYVFQNPQEAVKWLDEPETLQIH